MLLRKYKIRSLAEIENTLSQFESAIVRVDFNVPVRENKILDSTRILASLPTIQCLIKQKVKPLLISHLPDNLSFEPLLDEISQLLSLPITLAKNLEELQGILQTDKSKNLVLLDNIRFYPGEKNKDPALAKKLSKYSQLYINDAFSVCHRDHTSVTLLPRFAPVKVAGFALADELENLEKLFNKSYSGQKIALIGGKKISTKLPLLEVLLKDFDKVLVLGAMANSFLKSQGHDLDQSYYEESLLEVAQNLLKSNKIVLPRDFITRDDQGIKVAEIGSIRGAIVDLGPKSQELFSGIIKESDFLIWNGPAGLYEEGFSEGTKKLAQAIREVNIPSVAGGGDTLTLLKALEIEKNFAYVSKGGGAFLAWLVNNYLPGLTTLQL
jgi:phosphoglycerate kinase